MKKTILDVKGMHCMSCVMIVKDALAETKGVKSADVDLKHEKATVSFDEKLVSAKKLVDAIQKEGYKASVGK